MNVHVFETSVSSKDFRKHRKTFERVWQNLRWNFDFEDNQNILKIVDTNQDKSAIRSVHRTMRKLGFKCEEIF